MRIQNKAKKILKAVFLYSSKSNSNVTKLLFIIKNIKLVNNSGLISNSGNKFYFL